MFLNIFIDRDYDLTNLRNLLPCKDRW